MFIHFYCIYFTFEIVTNAIIIIISLNTLFTDIKIIFILFLII